MRFRKRPVEIEAWQFLNVGFSHEHLPQWLRIAFTSGVVQHKGDHLLVRTLEGDMRCELGSWIIQGVNGELYPCKNDIFRKTYEPVEEDDAVQE